MTIPMSFSKGRAWYVAACLSRHEKNIQAEIIRSGLDAYVPCSKRARAVRGRRIVEFNALFTGYVFVHFDAEHDPWQTVVVECNGVIGVLSNCQAPVRISDVLIDRIRRAEQAGSFDYTIPSAAFSVGESVEIKEGPFAGLIARVKNASAKKRIKVLLNVLGAATTLTVNPCVLAKVA